jgi:hypothetical protein
MICLFLRGGVMFVTFGGGTGLWKEGVGFKNKKDIEMVMWC